MKKQLFLRMLTLLTMPAFVFGQIDTTGLVAGVGVDEHLGATVDLTVAFRDQHGGTVRLGDLFQGKQPIILAPVYYSCPGMCSLILNGVRDLIEEMALSLGEDYKVVNISFDPENTPVLADAKAKNYYATLAEPEKASENWYFLTGSPEAIAATMGQIGFNYKKVEDQYSHASIIVLLSPNGKITRYIYGVTYKSDEVKTALVEASNGKVGNTLDKIYTFCFRYDPLAGKYRARAQNIMRAGGVLTLLFMSGMGFFLWRRELLNKRRVQGDA